MKNFVKIISFLLMITLLLSIITGCGVSKYSVTGTWICSLDGFTLNSDGSYIKASMSYSGNITDAEFGEYTIPTSSSAREFSPVLCASTVPFGR